MEYKVGAKVIIRKDCLSTLDEEGQCHGVYFNDEMKRLMGKVGTVTKARKSTESDALVYRVTTHSDVGVGGWLYVEEWLQPYGSKGGELL